MAVRLPCVGVSVGILLLGIVGCGSSGGPGSIHGKVTYRGAPVTGGTINFYFPGPKVAPGSIDSNGNYTAQLPATGMAQVAIETESVKPGNVPGEGESVGAPTYVRIPSKYADPKTSQITIEAKSGNQTKNFELVD